MPRIPLNLRERSSGMPNAGMTMNAVAMNNGCSTRAIRDIKQRFQATGCTQNRPRSGRSRVTTRDQDRYVLKTHRFQTATATASNTHGTYNNRISAKTVRNRLQDGCSAGTCTCISASKLYMFYFSNVIY